MLKKQRKHKKEILFIDASAHFGKATNQNYLREEDIERILKAVKGRKEIDKYAHVTTLQEIAEENDYNLNIPRYVDTFEEEEPIDLDAVVAEIKQIDAEMKETDKTIRKFCKELGIEGPV